jgi:hypothetical protein
MATQTEIVSFITVLFKSMEWFFWGAVIISAIHQANMRGCFDAMIRFMNWMLRLHDFQGQIAGTPQAFSRYSRDMLFLFFLNLVIISLIHVL